MKASEFIKEFGLDVAKELTGEPPFNDFIPQFDLVIEKGLDFHELQILVESHKLVDELGGLDALKSWVATEKSKLSPALYFHRHKPLTLINIENAEKAISDVESCQ